MGYYTKQAGTLYLSKSRYESDKRSFILSINTIHIKPTALARRESWIADEVDVYREPNPGDRKGRPYISCRYVGLG